MARNPDFTGLMSGPAGLGALPLSNLMAKRGGKGKQATKQQFDDATRTLGGKQGKSNLRKDKNGNIVVVPDSPLQKRSSGQSMKKKGIRRNTGRGK